MHIISKKQLKAFWEKHPDAEGLLRRWYKLMESTDFQGFNHLRETFESADQVGSLFVFNIGGGKYRLIVAIHFNSNRVYVQEILTHAEYDRNRWKK